MVAVYPGSENLDLGPKRCVAVCDSDAQAAAIVNTLWPRFGYVRRFSPNNIPPEVKEFLNLAGGCAEDPEVTPLCGDHAHIWYCERNHIRTQSGCIFCDVENIKSRMESIMEEVNRLRSSLKEALE